MDLICNELLLEILRRLPPPSASSASLVSRRWLRVHRWSRSSLSLPALPSALPLLPLYPSLYSLSLLPHADSDLDSFLADLFATPPPPSLRRLRLLAGPASPASLLPLAAFAPGLTSLYLNSLRAPLSLRFLAAFPRLRDLSLSDFKPSSDSCGFDYPDDELPATELALESLSLSGVGPGNLGLGWLWRSCAGRLRRLRLRSCAGTGDSFRYFLGALAGLQEIDLRTCRTIADRVLVLAALHATALGSLLVYDGGSRDGLLWFLTRAGPSLHTLDLRLPLDLEDEHLLAAAANFPRLRSLRLQSCCLVTGLGFRSLARPAPCSPLEELVLVNCDAVEREPGLLTTLAQNLKNLKMLDLSYNDKLVDKELGSMLASCGKLVEMRLRGCKGLTGSTLAAMGRSCKLLEVVDVMDCGGIGAEAVELFVLNSPRLGRIAVEEGKLSDTAKAWMSQRGVQCG